MCTISRLGPGQTFLIVHEIIVAAPRVDFIGLSFDAHAISMKSSRLFKLKVALDHVLIAGSMSCRGVEISLAHITWSMLAKREGLVLFDVHKHIRTHYDALTTLATEGRKERSCIRCSSPLPFSHRRCVGSGGLRIGGVSPRYWSMFSQDAYTGC